MIYTDTEAERLAQAAVQSRPSPIGSWIRAAFLHLVSATAKPHSPRDRDSGGALDVDE
jgi:hypothetical protein